MEVVFLSVVAVLLSVVAVVTDRLVLVAVPPSEAVVLLLVATASRQLGVTEARPRPEPVVAVVPPMKVPVVKLPVQVVVAPLPVAATASRQLGVTEARPRLASVVALVPPLVTAVVKQLVATIASRQLGVTRAAPRSLYLAVVAVLPLLGSAIAAANTAGVPCLAVKAWLAEWFSSRMQAWLLPPSRYCACPPFQRR